ncbi:MAG: MtrB/PioB family outer membrane beta-barrel protein [Puniceicoccales bacterium]|jgi:opacity protein-like surface antigen|nr:MtrB/PioB family outer membrane beta-barrel protein [Puniceicoccales bacterium]
MKVTKKNKTAAVLTLLLSAASLSHAAIPLYFPNENSYLTFALSTGVTYTDNVFANHIKVDDLMFSVTPSVSIETGRDAINRLSFSFSETFVNYLDNTTLDTQLASARLAYSFDPQSRLRVDVSASIDQLAQNDSIYWGSRDNNEQEYPEEPRKIIRRDYYAAGIDASYNLSEKLSTSFGFSYFNEHFGSLRTRYNDRQIYTVPLSLNYQIFEKIHLGISYSYSHTRIDPDWNSKNRVPGTQWFNPGTQVSHFIGLSTRGSYTAKLSFRGNVGFGYQSVEDRYDFSPNSTQSSIDDSYSTLNFSLSADYLLSEKSRLSLTSGRNFEVGGRAQNLTSTFARLNMTGYLNAFWQFNAYTSYIYQDFNFSNNRVDHVWGFGAGLSYLPVSWSRISLSYRYLRDVSNRIQDFNVNHIMLSIEFKL